MIHIELPLSKSQVNRALIAVAAKGNLLPWLSEHPEIAAQGMQRDFNLLIFKTPGHLVVCLQPMQRLNSRSPSRSLATTVYKVERYRPWWMR
jgi:hypothetical protein